MRAVLQRVTAARVLVGERVVGRIELGLLAFVGVSRTDGLADVAYVAAKIRDLRLFDGPDGKPMDRSVADTHGSVLVVSQFTLYGDTRRGRRPSFDDAAGPDAARQHYESLVRELRASGVPVETGEFRAHMQVELVNDGPVTLLIDSQRPEPAG